MLVEFSSVAAIAAASSPAPCFQDEKGRTREIKNPIEANKDKDWLGLKFPDATQPRIPVEVRVESDVEGAFTSGVASMLENTLMSTGRFKMFDSKSKARSKRARYTVTAQLVEYSPCKKGRGLSGIGGGLLGDATHGLVGGVDVSRSTAEIAISVRLIDARTGEVLQNCVLRGKSGNTNFGIAGVGLGSKSLGGGACPEFCVSA